jgi:hypothetical protein
LPLLFLLLRQLRLLLWHQLLQLPLLLLGMLILLTATLQWLPRNQVRNRL